MSNKKSGWTMIEGVIVLIMVGLVAVFIFTLGLVIKGCTAIQRHGLKNVVEQVWNGPTNATPTNTDIKVDIP